MIRLWGWWVALLSRTEPGTALALYRIACGICVLLTIGSVVAADLVDVIWIDRSFGGYRPLGNGPWPVSELGGPDPDVVWPMIWACTGSAVAMILGVGGAIGGRLVALATAWLFLGLSDLNGHAGGSYDELLSNGLWLAVLSHGTATLSLDRRIRTGRWTSDQPVAAWPRYLVIGQLVTTYWSTGLQKVSAYWTPAGGFSALYYILQQPSWHRTDMSWLAHVYPLTQAMTITTWLFELGAPIWLLLYWWRDTRGRPGRARAWANRVDLRSKLALFGIGLHLGVFALMNVGPFTWVTLAFYLCLWHPDEYAAAWARLRGGRGASGGV